MVNINLAPGGITRGRRLHGKDRASQCWVEEADCGPSFHLSSDQIPARLVNKEGSGGGEPAETGPGKGRRVARLDNNLGLGLLCANLAFLFYSGKITEVCVCPINRRQRSLCTHMLGGM